MSRPGRHGRLRRLADEWLLLGVLGALLGSSLLLVHVPASLWAGNTAEFHWRFGAFLRVGLATLGAGMIVVILVLAAVPRTARAVLASLLCAAGVVAWLHAFFLAGHMRPLNGVDAPMDFETPLGAWELVFVAGAWLLIGLAIARARGAAVVAVLVLNIGLAAATTVTVQSARRYRARAPVLLDAGQAFRFSTQDNVLVVLLDGLQSDVAHGILRNDPRLTAAFDGFRFYRNTLGVAPTTIVSLAAIHSGDVYRGQADVSAYFEESIRIRSFMSRFAEAGYDAALVNPIDGACPARVTTCASSSQILYTADAQFTREGLRLLDVSLFRLAPVWLKRRIYADGQWFLAGRFDLAEETSRIFEHNLLLHEMARRLTVDDGAPTLKFVHSLATHMPFVLNSDCQTFGANSPAQMEPQARCALEAVAALMEALKTAGVYDQTEIALLADHGIGLPNRYIPARRSRDTAWARLAGSANPMFLLKPRRARGALTEDVAGVHLPDLGATLCASSGVCTTPSGVPAGQASPRRPRRFLDHDWQHAVWQLRDISQMVAHEVRGPLWDRASWHRVGDERNGE